MAINFDEWVLDIAKKGNLSDQEVAHLKSILTKPGVSNEVSNAFERQSDYSRKMNELQAKMQAEDDYAQRLVEWEQSMKDQLSNATQQAEAYRKQVYTIAQQYGVSPDELQKAINMNQTQQTTVATTPAQPEQPQGNWVSKQEIDNYGAAMFKISGKLMKCQQEHIRLFGKPIEDIDDFTEKALTSGKPIEETFRTHFNVAQREAEINEASVQARIQKAIDEAKQSWITAGANPLVGTTVPKGEGSPVFEQIETSKTLGEHYAADRRRVQEAVNAFNASQTQNGSTP